MNAKGGFMENKVFCTIVSVDCAHNDPVDIRCGGPEYLGFDFGVKTENVDEMIKFIQLTLEQFNVPCISITKATVGTLPANRVWNKHMIVAEILKDKEKIVFASKRYGGR